MSKRTLVLLGVSILGLVTLSGIGFYLYPKLSNKNFTNPLPTINQTSQKEGTKPGVLLLYEDEAGFSFQYPDNLGIVEKDVNDSDVYSSLELSSKSYPGEKLVIKISDTSLKTVNQWLEKNPQEGNLVTSAETILGGMKGESFKYANPSRNLILVIDGGILYFLEAPADNGFWDQAIKTVSSSFQLSQTEISASSTQGSSSIIDEGEEIIE